MSEYERREKAEKHTPYTKIVLVVLLLGAILIFIALSATPIDTGERGIVFVWGKADRILEPGWNWKIPIAESVITINVKVQTLELTKLSAGAKGMIEVTTSATISYQLSPNSVLQIYTEFGLNYEGYIMQSAVDSLKTVTPEFEPEELINRALVADKFQTHLAARLAKYQINIVQVTLSDFQFSPEMMQQIEAKGKAKQEAETAKFLLEKVRYEQEQAVIKAEAEARIAKIQADAYYNATLTRAKADAEALRLIREQINSELLQKIALERWDGKLPYFMGSGNLPFIINLPSNSTSPGYPG